MAMVKLVTGLMLVMFCSACVPGQSSTATSGGGEAFGVSAAQPSEIVMPLNFGTHMKGSAETPARDTRAQGQLVLQVSADGESMSYRLLVSGIYNVVASHIHEGSVGVPGPAVVFLYGNAAPGGGRHDGVLSTGTLTAANLIGPLAGQPLSALVDLIRSGNAYANVHTNDGVAPTNTGPGDYPAGEIRGQVGR